MVGMQSVQQLFSTLRFKQGNQVVNHTSKPSISIFLRPAPCQAQEAGVGARDVAAKSILAQSILSEGDQFGLGVARVCSRLPCLLDRSEELGVSHRQLQVAKFAQVHKGKQADTDGSRLEPPCSNLHLLAEGRQLKLTLAHVHELRDGAFLEWYGGML